MSVRRSLVRLLRAHNYEVLEVDSAARALEMLATQLPSVILMDIVMPGEGSLDAVRRIKGEPLTAAVPIIALTASPPSAPQDLALFAGVMLKPADAHALLDTIAATAAAARSAT
jgi:CheY-like chemotaxis protein